MHLRAGALPQRPQPALQATFQSRSCITTVTRSLNRRDVLISTSGLILSAADRALAEDTEQQPAADAAAGQPPAAAAEQAQAAGASKGPKRRRKLRPAGSSERKSSPKAAPKPPGTIPRVKLADDLEISKVIRGCWQLDGQHKGDQLSDRTSGSAAIEDLDTFCRHGMFTLDTADIYGPSEAIIGQHLRLNPAAAHRTKVLTKLSFMSPPQPADLRRENIEYRVRSSIARLGVTRLDLVQLHWEPPQQQQQQQQAASSSSSSSKAVPGFVQAARVLKQLQEEGLVGQLGVSNFDQKMLMALLDAGIKPVSNQVCYSVMDRRPSLFLSRFCEARGIPLLCYGTLGGGFIAERFLDVPANMARIDTVSKARYGTLLRQLGGWSWLQDMIRALHDVGEKHGVSASCVAARWVLQQPSVSAIILGARNASHVRDAQRLFSFELDEIDLLDIDAAYEGANQPTADVYVWERGGEW